VYLQGEQKPEIVTAIHILPADITLRPNAANFLACAYPKLKHIYRSSNRTKKARQRIISRRIGGDDAFNHYFRVVSDIFIRNLLFVESR
jgi:hypothetical protein